MRLKIIAIILFFTTSLFSQDDNSDAAIFDNPTGTESPKHTIKVNTIQPLGFLVDNRAGKGFDLQYERPINTESWKERNTTNLKGEPRYTSINIRGFYSLFYTKKEYGGAQARTYEKTGGSVMIKRYRNADRNGRFLGFSVTAASLVYRDIYEDFEKDDSLHGFFAGIGLAWGKTYRRGNWSIEPVLQIGIGLTNVDPEDIAKVEKSQLGATASNPSINRNSSCDSTLGGLDRCMHKAVKTFSNSYFAINLGYDL